MRLMIKSQITNSGKLAKSSTTSLALEISVPSLGLMKVK